MVSNMVIQLLHSIKFSMEVPFSNMTQQPVEMQKTLQTKKVQTLLWSLVLKFYILQATKRRYWTGRFLFNSTYFRMSIKSEHKQVDSFCPLK